MQARCKVQGRFRRFRVVWCRPGVRFKEPRFRRARCKVPGVRFKEPLFRRARCKVQGRFRRFRGDLVQARCKVQGRFWRYGVVWRRPGQHVPEVSGWCKVQGSRVPPGWGGVVQRCEVQARFRRLRVRGVLAGSRQVSGFRVVWLVQAECKVQAGFWSGGAGRSKEGSGSSGGPGQVEGSRQVPEVPGGVVTARCKVQGRCRRFRGRFCESCGVVRALKRAPLLGISPELILFLGCHVFSWGFSRREEVCVNLLELSS